LTAGAFLVATAALVLVLVVFLRVMVDQEIVETTSMASSRQSCLSLQFCIMRKSRIYRICVSKK
jgi:hypothetical protein